MRYFLIAGETSGEQHAARLMIRLQELDPDVQFRFIGGDRMQEVGGVPVIHIRDLAFMGFTQLLSRVRVISRSFRRCRQEIRLFNPDLIIPVDFGGFNLRIIRWACRNGYRSTYYITPKVWAWQVQRARKLARYTVRSLCILPFEPSFLARYGAKASYVGNPVVETIRRVGEKVPTRIDRETGEATKPVIALLPGSREQEIRVMLPVMLSIIPDFPDCQFVVAGCDPFDESFYRSFIRVPGVTVVYNQTHELVRSARAALVTSGTATLETALLGTPQVVCYRTTWLSYLIARMLIRVKFISLVNLILDKSCVTELIQGSLSHDTLARETQRILQDPVVRESMIQDYHTLKQLLGDQDASAEAARQIFQIASGS